MSADTLRRGPQGGGGLPFEPTATRLDAFQCLYDLLFGLFGDFAAGGLHEFLRVMDECDQVLHQALLRAFFASNILEERFHNLSSLSPAYDTLNRPIGKPEQIRCPGRLAQ